MSEPEQENANLDTISQTYLLSELTEGLVYFTRKTRYSSNQVNYYT